MLTIQNKKDLLDQVSKWAMFLIHDAKSSQEIRNILHVVARVSMDITRDMYTSFSPEELGLLVEQYTNRHHPIVSSIDLPKES